MKIYYSLFSGIIYEVFDQEVPNLDEGQIPLKKIPSHACKKCHGRGFSHYDKERGIYPICPCLRKCIQDGYKPTTVKLLPKLD